MEIFKEKYKEAVIYKPIIARNNNKNCQTKIDNIKLPIKLKIKNKGI